MQQPCVALSYHHRSSKLFKKSVHLSAQNYLYKTLSFETSAVVSANHQVGLASDDSSLLHAHRYYKVLGAIIIAQLFYRKIVLEKVDTAFLSPFSPPSGRSLASLSYIVLFYM